MKPKHTAPHAPLFASTASRVLLAFALTLAFMFCMNDAAFAQNKLFEKPAGEAGSLFDGFMKIVQIICFVMYLLAIYWVYEAMKDFKDGKQAEGWRGIAAAFGIFVSPGLVQLLRSWTSSWASIG